MTSTRERILEASAELFRRQGYTGTGMKQIVAAANAPFGSLYHFFPEGKEQLGAEVVRSAGLMYQQLLESILDAAPDIVTGVRDCFLGAAELLKATGYADACPIAAVALEVANTNETLRQATADVFDHWIDAGTARFIEAGIPAPAARDLAIHLITSLEGAFILSRAMRTTEPIEKSGKAAAAAVEAAMETADRMRHRRKRAAR